MKNKRREGANEDEERKRERGVDKSPQYETLVTEKARVTRDSTRAWRRLCGELHTVATNS